MKRFLTMCMGFIATLITIDLWAGTFAPKVTPTERVVLDHTFYDQNTQLDADFSAIRQHQGRKVIGLGDSTMYGALVYQNETIPYALRKLLQQRDASVGVYNLAYPGARPADLYAMLKRSLSAHPDLIVMDVNVIFFSPQILAEGALANTMLRSEFLFDPYVPKGVLPGSRIDSVAATLVKSTAIGQFKPEINQRLFGKPLRDQVAETAKRTQPAQALLGTGTGRTAGAAADAGLPAPVIGQGWHEKTWGAAEQKNMARIYDQGLITPDNDSLRMLKEIVDYGKRQHMPILFYLTPQNDALIGKFYSLTQLHANEDKLLTVLHEEGAWVLDLRNGVTERDFGDYDHLLRDGNQKVAVQLASAIQESKVLSR